MAEEHDKIHRLIFSFPRMIEDLIRLCLGGAWVDRLDFSTLEKASERLVSPELLRREQDILWRLAYRSPETEAKKAEWFYVYLHLEHQSNPRRKMALYTTNYKLLAWQDLIRQRMLTPDEKLPPILSVVFYTGERSWNVNSSLLDEIQALPDSPRGLDLWSYQLIDASRYPLDGIMKEDSPVVGLFQLTQIERAEQIPERARKLAAVLGPEDEELRKAFVTMINEEILPRFARDGQEPLRINDLHEEMPTMLEATMDRVIGKLERESEAKGRAEGEVKGQAYLFLKLFTTRYGNVPDWVRERVDNADTTQLETWAKRLFTAESPEAVFA